MRRVRELLETRAARMWGEISRVRRTAGVDAIHDLRVATRRLQEALDFFEPCLPGRYRRRLARRARRIRRELSEIRTTDVTLELLAKLARSLPAGESRDLERLRTRLRAALRAPRRAASGRRSLAVSGARKRSSSLLARLDGAGTFDLLDRGRKILDARVGETVRLIPPASSGSPEALHRLRIAVKRYRYALEILEQAGWGRPRGAIAAARTIQEELGRLHDLDVLTDLIRRARSGETPVLLRRLDRERARRLLAVRKALKGFPPAKGRPPGDGRRARPT
jgi:CHAD domain-containing protein